ncbi:TetR family transcriptional regulator [Sphingomonas sp. BK235]|nr:TetR family transcriptional regulator [Sphingomonas sp. BK235]
MVQPPATRAVPPAPPRRRLAKPARRRQLLEVARAIVRDEGADRLTLGHLAARAGVSKPVAYDHFATRSGLLIALYRMIDTDRVLAFRDAMRAGGHDRDATVALLAEAYIDCAAETGGEFQAVGAALAGSEEKAAVFEELLDQCVAMFVDVLAPHAGGEAAALARRCVGLVGAGEALAAALRRGRVDRAGAIAALAALVDGALAPRDRAQA